jgi:hypothetical protein
MWDNTVSALSLGDINSWFSNFFVRTTGYITSTSSPYITISPKSGPINTNIHVVGSGFEIYAPRDASKGWYQLYLNDFDVMGVGSNSNGNIDFYFTIQDWMSPITGENTISLRKSRDEIVAQDTFTLTSTVEQTGYISGIVLDANNSSTIPGTEVSDGTRITATNNAGQYSIFKVPIGDYTVTASKSGYVNQSKKITVYVGQTTTVNFYLSKPCSCAIWKNVGCGLSPCSSTQMQQKRTCSPTACDVEQTCVSNPSCGGATTTTGPIQDITPPTVSNMTGSPENPTTSDEITIFAIATDTQSNIALCRIAVDNQSGSYQDMIASDGTYDEKTENIEKNIGKLSEGAHAAYIICKDSSDNWSLPNVRVIFNVSISSGVEITSFTCNPILNTLKAQCTVKVSGLESIKNYYIYVGGDGTTTNKPSAGATITPGTDKPITIVVLALINDTYRLGAFVFEGTNPDVIRPALMFWIGSPVEIYIS